MREKPYFIRVEWDEDARVWVATSDDVPGLVTEGSSLEAFIEKLRTMIPELLEANGQGPPRLFGPARQVVSRATLF